MNDLMVWIDTVGFVTLLFPATFFVVAVWEALQPSRQVTTSLTLRWFGNSAVYALGVLVVRMLPFLSGTGAAVIANEYDWGLLNVVAVPSTAAMVFSFIALDLFAYWMHRLFHAFSPFWRLHALHHSDGDVDVTTTIRHHPLEVLVDMPFSAFFAILVGFPPEAVASYTGIALVVQAFAHGNVLLPNWMRLLNAFVMTPDRHRLHHSTLYAESNSNFGNTFLIWDYLFGTLRLHPEGELRTGLPEFVGAKFQRLDKMLIQPLQVVIAHPQK